MSTFTSTDRIEEFFDHLAVLRLYAHRVLIEGQELSKGEDEDRAHRMTAFLDLGLSLDLSMRELVGILLRELLDCD